MGAPGFLLCSKSCLYFWTAPQQKGQLPKVTAVMNLMVIHWNTIQKAQKTTSLESLQTYFSIIFLSHISRAFGWRLSCWGRNEGFRRKRPDSSTLYACDHLLPHQVPAPNQMEFSVVLLVVFSILRATQQNKYKPKISLFKNEDSQAFMRPRGFK